MPTLAAPLILLRCHYCSEHQHPKEFVELGEAALMCWSCWEKHSTQIEVFDPPHECQVCKRTFEQIAAATPGNKVSMWPHWKDGTYQILCTPCDEVYVRSRRDLYGPTRFGWDRKLQ